MKLAQEHDMAYFETSAAQNFNIKEMMEHIMDKVYDVVY